MKRWALVVMILYLLILVVLTFPVILLAFAPQAKVTDAVEGYGYLPYWLWAGVMGVGPAVYFLYVDRWRRLHPEPAGEPEPLA